MNEKKHILALDIGTTIIRCSIKATPNETKATAFTKVQLLYPEKGYVEIDPEELWKSIKYVICKVVRDSGINPSEIAGMGISTQRSSFITWKKNDGYYFHNFITWKDVRADNLVKSWNKSLTLKAIRFFAYCLHLISRDQRMLTLSAFQTSNIATTLRLVWAIENIPELRRAIEKNNAMFGTMDTWLIYKLTRNQTYAIEITNAAATGMFDPFRLQWNILSSGLFHFPLQIMPPIVDSDHDFGMMDKDILGVEIPINCVMGDQSSAMFGSGCFNRGDIKFTLGTGSFLDVNTGIKTLGSRCGMYPLVAWKFSNGELAYMLEASANDSGSLVEWMIDAGLVRDAFETSSIAEGAKDNGGVYFVPAFSGLGHPINDAHATTGFIGIVPTTKQCHMVRAVMESIVFRSFLLFEVLKKERSDEYKVIRVDGGVSTNDFICKSLASITNLKVERTFCIEGATQGVTYLAGLKAGLWTRDHLREMEHNIAYLPDPQQHEYYLREVKVWLKAVDRFKTWT